VLAAAAGTPVLWYVSRASGLVLLGWPVAFVHSLTAGNDLGIWWVALIEWACVAAVATAIIARILFAVRGGVVPGTPSDTGVPPEIPADFFTKERVHR
jgi:hypothetical protein